VYLVEPYRSEVREEWDTFVSQSRNGTFLFARGYMDYHAARFEDASLVFRNKAGQVVALLPASRACSRVSSLGGLTYGGLILGREARTRGVLCLLEEGLEYYRRAGVASVLYKCVPRIYHRLVSEEDLYALFRLGASLVRRDVSSTVQPASRLPPQRRRSRGVRKAREVGVRVERSVNFASFWPVLEEGLLERHGVRPVHTLDEMTLLAVRFPEQIKLFLAIVGATAVAGTVIYETPCVAHAQYIGSTERGRETGALDLLFAELIGVVYRDKPYFDFGISTAAEGTELNDGLIDYKEGHGATATVHDFYRVEL
jgi:hypothetical protein